MINPLAAQLSRFLSTQFLSKNGPKLKIGYLHRSCLTRLVDDERLELLLVGGNLGGSLEPGDKLKSKRKIFKPPPTSFSAGADLIKVQKRFLTNKAKF